MQEQIITAKIAISIDPMQTNAINAWLRPSLKTNAMSFAPNDNKNNH